MDYHYELLGEDRFQLLCQSIINREYPNVQCFPIGQPDGGRDATAVYLRKSNNEFVVFQVKFVKRPHAEADPHRWLSSIVAAEAPKVRELVPQGAMHYVLLTNIQGTAHFQVGSIDRVDAILQEHLPVPAMCWWRDDLSRRLDNAFDLKWKYPELMTGTDMLRWILESGLTEDKARRIAAIKTSLRAQYENDKEIRFRQIDLRSNLIDLFIDVPINIRSGEGGETTRRFLWTVARRAWRRARQIENLDVLDSDDPAIDPSAHAVIDRTGEERYIGAVEVLLQPLIQEHLPQLVLEGAPGQGKSTISQYICQLHRMKLLEETELLNSLPAKHTPKSVRIPFRVDLRDFATWLDKQDPFSSNEHPAVPDGWEKSLEGLLAAQIRYYSGGLAFSVFDLHAVAQVSAMLLVLDGLDEVADITERQEVVSEVMKSVNRLRESSASLQVVITSRPAAFANSPGFPERSFPHLQLSSVTRVLIDEYAEKWIAARKLEGRAAGEVRRVLRDKLAEPHLRDLARNPMQLAILLSLVHTRGSSLPDKRTALYDSYIELFFNRESEKNETIREHRDLLINIHRYLAWVLHSEAEEGNNRGSISTERLRRLLVEYLELEGHDTTLVSELFTGMIDRVVALVSRVQGTFEFEVQPLREYFVARHLYDTAPYSPTGSERRGSMPDRFDAIARNFYWLNVTRFFAGCLSKGELATLADRLAELAQAEGYRNISHPRVLAAMLLSDWVFAQTPKLMGQVVSLTLDGLGLRYVMNSRGARYSADVGLVLPKNCGRDELLDRCFGILESRPAQDYAIEIIDLVRANAAVGDIRERWHQATLRMTGQQRTEWMRYGLYLGTLPTLTEAEIDQLLEDEPCQPARLNLLLDSHAVQIVEGSPERASAVVDSFLNASTLRVTQRRSPSIINRFKNALSAVTYSVFFRAPQPVLAVDVLTRYQGGWSSELEVTYQHTNPVLERCLQVIQVAEQEQRRYASVWASEIEPWDNILEVSRSIWGERWAHFQFANIAAGIKSQTETCKEFSDLLDHSQSLCRRARYARLRAGGIDWWRSQLATATNDLERSFVSLVLLTWSSSRTLRSLASSVDDVLKQLTPPEWNRLMLATESAISAIYENSAPALPSLEQDFAPEPLSDRMLAALAIRARWDQALDIYTKYFSQYEGSDPVILRFCQKAALYLFETNDSGSDKGLRLIARSYAEGFPYGRYGPSQGQRPGSKQMSEAAAREITSHPEKYPRRLVVLAEAQWRRQVEAGIVPVSKIAQEEGWFE